MQLFHCSKKKLETQVSNADFCENGQMKMHKNPITMQLIRILTLVDIVIKSIGNRPEWQATLETI